MLYKDIPTKFRVLRNGRKRVVYARVDWDGHHVRYITKVSKRERETRRNKEYYGTKVGINDWTEVNTGEL